MKIKICSICAVILLMLLVGCGSEVVNFNKIVEKDGIYYYNENKPFTGKTEAYYGNALAFEANIKNGKWNGEYICYYKKGASVGRIAEILNYNDGELDGKVQRFDDYGTLTYLAEYKKGTLIKETDYDD